MGVNPPAGSRGCGGGVGARLMGVNPPSGLRGCCSGVGGRLIGVNPPSGLRGCCGDGAIVVINGEGGGLVGIRKEKRKVVWVGVWRGGSGFGGGG